MTCPENPGGRYGEARETRRMQFVAPHSLSFSFFFINVVLSGIPLECRPPPVDEVGSLTYIK